METKLYPIHAMGIRAYCSDIIVDPDEPDTVYFLSICGYQATVKGITANFIENYGINLELGGEDYYLERSSLGYKVLVKKLPSGLTHAVAFPKLALPKNDEESQNRFFVFTNGNRAPLKLFFRHLDEKVELPLHPSWARWLWKMFQELDWLARLKTLVGSYKGFSFMFNPSQLHDLISEALKNRNRDIIGCMEWKGESSDGKCDFTQGISK